MTERTAEPSLTGAIAAPCGNRRQTRAWQASVIEPDYLRRQDPVERLEWLRADAEAEAPETERDAK